MSYFNPSPHVLIRATYLPIPIMSLLRAVLLFIQVPCYQVASTPPNKTPARGRYDASTPWHLRIASSVIQAQQPIVWICTLADLILILSQQSLFPLPRVASSTIQSAICPFPSSGASIGTLSHSSSILNATLSSSPSASPHIHATTLSLCGLLLVMFGTFLRFTCYRTLGSLFTFDLTIQPKHKLITAGPYAFVRHPAYSGSLSVMLGLALINLTQGSWIAECGVLGFGSDLVGGVVRTALFVAWYTWWLAVGVHRAELEDGELRKLFGKEWETYSKSVRCWFVPGVF
ncbi:hypothetical protein EUX98_g2832 [Antrodiella citrinella]|uniref:Protein-S-isoprenylcysteine O-methyltransferase n=1 Tax=Antrodiella citrinella TaxID=2447956 RepID=A0A4S4MY17_9APHY|nr:hypothetical protein EUX98_g2832 [Antrodiella citrinella]